MVLFPLHSMVVLIPVSKGHVFFSSAEIILRDFGAFDLRTLP